jgi:hypothetical protein
MIKPEDFKRLWQIDVKSKLYSFSDDSVGLLNIPFEAKKFLVEAGLPEEAAPLLTFGVISKKPLELASDVFGLPKGFSRYYIIGSNGSGDPICIDEANEGAIVLLNHDCKFKSVFVNTSVMQIAESLLAYRDLVNDAIKENGTDAYLDWNIPICLLEQTKSVIQKIDPVALEKETFWFQNLS